jgi:GTP cyclohydrolase II
MPEKKSSHIRLTSHPGGSGSKPLPIQWGAGTPAERGPLIATLSDPKHRNVIGSHSGSYAVYRALAVACGSLDPEHKADLTDTAPSSPIGPHPSWHDPSKIVSIDPYGAVVARAFADHIEAGRDVRPSIAITQAHIHLPEIERMIESGALKPDGKILTRKGEILVTKAAIEPVWHLPGVAARFGIEESTLRRCLFEYTGGMFPELVTRGDLEVFFPPIGGHTAYIFGDIQDVSDPSVELSVRVHDECNGSDVFGSDICTCRPYLVHGVQVCVETVMGGGVGAIVYNRKEGRALGEVTKFLVYNARKRQEGGDTAAGYFTRTECVAGVQDMRFQVLMPDALHWLGITKIDRFISMSNLKYDPVVASGIEICERVSIPEDLIPADARVEMDAKKAAGYYTEGVVPDEDELREAKGRAFDA